MLVGIFSYAGKGCALYFGARNHRNIQGERTCSCARSMLRLTTVPTPAQPGNYPGLRRDRGVRRGAPSLCSQYGAKTIGAKTSPLIRGRHLTYREADDVERC